MVIIGNKLILMYLIEIFVRQKFNDFIFCPGHQLEIITNYFISQMKNIKIISKDKKNLKIFFDSKVIKFNGD